MEGPVNGQIYATVNSIKTESELEMMKSPSPNILDANNHRSSHGHHYVPQRSPNSSLSPRPNPSHHQMQPSDPDQRCQREERNHSSIFHGSRKIKENEQNYHQANSDIPSRFQSEPISGAGISFDVKMKLRISLRPNKKLVSKKLGQLNVQVYIRGSTDTVQVPIGHGPITTQCDHEAAFSKRVAPMWSPSSDISTSYRDPHENSTPQQKQVSHRSATQAEIDKLDDLLQELTPRLNDSPSEYSRRRRQSFSSTSKTGAYEGRNRQDTFIQGFSPTSPIEAQNKSLMITDTNDPQHQQHQQQQQQQQQQMMITASLARAPLVERSNSQSNLEMTPRHARNTNWHSEEKKRLQRTRSLLDEKDKYLTEQLRRIQARSGVRDIRDGSAMSPIGRPGSSQQILSDMVARYNSGTGKEYTTASDWEEVRLFSDQHSSTSTRRATSEMEYPLRDMSVDRRNNSPVVGATSRRRPLIRHYSDRDEFSFARQRHNSDNHASRTGPSNRSYSPITNYRHLNGSPAQPDLPFDAPDDIPLMQRRNIRTNIHSARLPANNLINNEAAVGAKMRDRNIESLPMCHVPKVGGPLSPMTSNIDLPMMPVANLKESERARATPDMINKTRNSGFQIRADNSTRASGISYHDPDEAYLSSDSYPIVSRLTLSQSPSEQQANNKIPPLPNQRRVQHVHHRSDEMSNQNSSNISDRELDSLIGVQDPHNARSYNATVKSANHQNSQNSSLRKSAKIWYQPNMSREEAVKTLKGKPPGSFVVRQSHTFNNSYGLAVNVPRTSTVEDDDRCVRHFLIESNTKGVRIRGCSNEPYFGSLTALVHQHTLTKLALPCCLILPISESDLDDQQSSYDSCNKNNTPKVSSLFAPKTFSALYLGSIDTESLTGAAALSKAVEILLENKTEVKQTEVSIRISPEGLTLTDVLRKLFFRRHYPLNSISYCGTENSTYWDSAETRSRGFAKSKIFGFVARKTGTTENMCHLLCEWHPQDNSRAITNFISCCVPGT